MANEITPQVVEKYATDDCTLRVIDVSKTARFQLGGLMIGTRRAFESWRASVGTDYESIEGVTTILCAHAALEAIANEWSYRASSRDVYDYVRGRSGRENGSFRERLAFAVARAGGAVPDDAADVIAAKNAIAHSEPENNRLTRANDFLNAGGAERALAVVTALHSQMFPGDTPAPDLGTPELPPLRKSCAG